MRVLVLGGYGNFGARICRALAAEALEVVAASRDPIGGQRRTAFDPRIRHAALDMQAPDFASALRAQAPHVVVHCVGPFQGQDYRVAEICIAAGIHYIDLADGRDFVAGFSDALDAAARKAGVLAVAGASTLPGLSASVVDHHLPRFRQLERIDTCIAPGQQAPRGKATLEGVFSYLGRPFQRWEDGRWQTRHGWLGLHRVSVAGVGRRWAAACDVPDLALFPLRYPGVRTVHFEAALEVAVEHGFLAVVAQLRRLGLNLPIERLAAPLDHVAGWLNRFGSPLGGMSIRMSGTDLDGDPLMLHWQLVAPDNLGPEIPCLAAILLALRLCRAGPPVVGARPCTGLLTLAEFQPEFDRRGLHSLLSERRG